MCDETCFLVLVFPVLSLIYLAISSFRPEKYDKIDYFISFINCLVMGLGPIID